MTPRRGGPSELETTAQRLVASLAEDPAFIATVAEKEIARRINDGELVPIERLRIAKGLELAPAGLEKAARDLVQAIVTGGDPGVLVAKCAGVLGIETTRKRKRGGKEPKEQATPQVPPPEPESVPVAGKKATAPPRVRSGPPQVDDEHVCAQCGAGVNYEKALVTWAKVRRVLCAEHAPEEQQEATGP